MILVQQLFNTGGVFQCQNEKLLVDIFRFGSKHPGSWVFSASGTREVADGGGGGRGGGGGGGGSWFQCWH